MRRSMSWARPFPSIDDNSRTSRYTSRCDGSVSVAPSGRPPAPVPALSKAADDVLSTAHQPAFLWLVLLYLAPEFGLAQRTSWRSAASCDALQDALPALQLRHQHE